MNANTNTADWEIRTKLSTLWIVVAIDMAYADILSLFVPGVHEELLAFAAGTPVTQIMLIGAILVQFPIIMIFLSRILKYKTNRWANIIIGTTQSVFVIAGGSTNPHYMFIATIEIVCMLLIIWYAWNWADPEA